MNREACKQKWHANNSLLFTSTHDGGKSVECNCCNTTISADTKYANDNFINEQV